MTAVEADPFELEVPADVAAEKYVLSAMLWSPSSIDDAAEILEPGDFYREAHKVIFHAMISMRAAGKPVDVVTLHAELARHSELRALGGEQHARMYLHELSATPSPGSPGYHAQIVFDRKVRRSAIERATRVMQAARALDMDPSEVAAAAAAEFASVPARAVSDPAGVPMTAGAFAKLDTPRTGPVIDTLLHREDRVIVVGEEGHGKSVMTWQMGFSAACGRHPFRSDVRFEPRRVLLVDLENPRSVVQDRVRMFSALAARYDGWDPDQVVVWSWPQGLNLRRASDAHMLAEHIRRARPDLVVAGPAYQMTEGGKGSEDSEQVHSAVTRFWGQMRGRYGFAFILEHHPPLQTTSKAPRIMRPAFSGVYSRWPEFGLALILTKDSTLEVGRFRGDRIAGRSWPLEIKRHEWFGRDWPWKAVRWPDGTFSKTLEESS